MAGNVFTMALKKAQVKPSNVMTPLDRELNRRLHKLGSFVRQTARRSIKKSKKSADPGDPPRSHQGAVKNLILYQVELDDRNVVIGPRQAQSQIVKFIEYGGEEEIMVYPWWVASGDERQQIKRRVKADTGQQHNPASKVSIRVRYEPRPFMRPAFSKEIRQNSELWGDLI